MPNVRAMSSTVQQLGPVVAWRAKRCAIAMPIVPTDGVYQTSASSLSVRHRAGCLLDGRVVPGDHGEGVAGAEDRVGRVLGALPVVGAVGGWSWSWWASVGSSDPGPRAGRLPRPSRPEDRSRARPGGRASPYGATGRRAAPCQPQARQGPEERGLDTATAAAHTARPPSGGPRHPPAGRPRHRAGRSAGRRPVADRRPGVAPEITPDRPISCGGTRHGPASLGWGGRAVTVGVRDGQPSRSSPSSSSVVLVVGFVARRRGRRWR